MLELGTPGIVVPQVVHCLEPQGSMGTVVEFHTMSGRGPPDPRALQQEDLPGG